MDKRKRRLLCMLEGSGRKSRWISGVPPLSFKALAARELENYRIYGNTVGGESVGDLVESGEHAGEYKVPVTVGGKNLFSSRIEQGSIDGMTGVPNNSPTRVRSHEDDYIFLTPGVYKISAMGVEHYAIKAYDLPDVSAFNYNLSMQNWVPLSYTITINTSAYYKFVFCKTNNPIITPSDVSNMMLNTGSTALPYEPYHTPVTTPIYLPEPIKMVGDEAEYIDYAEQKQYRIGADDIDVTLPALPTLPGTNVLSVGTAVQPSEIEVKGKIKAL